MQITSISLPKSHVAIWRKHRKDIMLFAERYLRLAMRNPTMRNCTRRYNRSNGPCAVITARFSGVEYDTLHAVASALRVSASSLIFGIIKLWQKPSRHQWPWMVESNYDFKEICWRTYAGLIEENLLFYITRKPPNLIPDSV